MALGSNSAALRQLRIGKPVKSLSCSLAMNGLNILTSRFLSETYMYFQQYAELFVRLPGGCAARACRVWRGESEFWSCTVGAEAFRINEI